VSERETVLVVEDDAAMRLLIEEELAAAGLEVLAAGDGNEAVRLLERRSIDAVVTDLMMPGRKGREVLAEVRSKAPEVPVIIMTAFGGIDDAVEAIKAGAYHFVAKPFPVAQLVGTVQNALREKRLKTEISALRETLGDAPTGLVAASSSMRRVLETIARASEAASPVLVVGESGTGKELLARALHAKSRRRDGPFVAVNCSAIPENLLESQLFGHRRGSFTDAKEDRRGLFQEADGGTIFLDEIGDMPAPLQAKLLRVLQEREVHPLGAPAPIAIDIRVIAATHRDIESLARDGLFRQDLFYRLNVITIRVPPLRERPDDLLPLVAHFLEKHGRLLRRPGCTLAPGVIEALRRHAWPGNVRELENVIERGLVMSRDDVIGEDDLPESLRGGPARTSEDPETSIRTLADVERDHIVTAIRRLGGNKAAAARVLGLDRKTLYRKLESYGLD